MTFNELINSAELAEKISAAKTIDEGMQILSSYGLSSSAGELRAYFESLDAELTEDDLEYVAGGRSFVDPLYYPVTPNNPVVKWFLSKVGKSGGGGHRF